MLLTKISTVFLTTLITAAFSFSPAYAHLEVKAAQDNNPVQDASTINRAEIEETSRELKDITVKYTGQEATVGEKVHRYEIDVIPTYITQYNNGERKEITDTPISCAHFKVFPEYIKHPGVNVIKVTYQEGSKIITKEISINASDKLIDPSGYYVITAENEVSYTGRKYNYSKYLYIPDTIKDDSGKVYKVTSIAPNALKNNKKIAYVYLGKNMRTIKKGAFSGCKGLRQLVFHGYNIKTIEKNAFKGIKKNTRVIFDTKKKPNMESIIRQINKRGGANTAYVKNYR